MNCCCANTDGVAMVLRNIIRLQREAVRDELREETCFANRLGCGRLEEFNTRPLQVFTDDDKAWGCPVHRNSAACVTEEKTCVFRIEKIEGCTATFRALIPNGEMENFENPENPCVGKRFIATDSFKTIKLPNISAIRCLNDTFVDLCIRNF